MPESARSLAVLCDEEGVVVEVIDARLDLLRPPCVGADLGCVVAAGSEEKLAAFLRELHDQLGEVGLERVDADGGERVVEADLVGRHRLDLDDLADALRLHEPGHDRGRFLWPGCG